MVVKLDLRQPGLLQERLELQLGDGAPVERLPGLRSEYEAVRVAGLHRSLYPIYLPRAGTPGDS
jgi:hypothetical protein